MVVSDECLQSIYIDLENDGIRETCNIYFAYRIFQIFFWISGAGNRWGLSLMDKKITGGGDLCVLNSPLKTLIQTPLDFQPAIHTRGYTEKVC